MGINGYDAIVLMRVVPLALRVDMILVWSEEPAFRPCLSFPRQC